MQISIKKYALYLIVSIILTLGLSISLQSLLAAWTAPTASPPGDNIAKPLYATSSDPQWIHKVGVNGGSLGVEGKFSVGEDTYFAGNVGIGTTTPGYKLTVNSANDTDNLFQVATTTNQGIFVINSDGNVGIGTMSPGAKLDVDGSIHSTSDICTDSAGGQCLSNAGDNLGNHSATENIKLGGNWISGNSVGDETDEGMYIDTDGNVGIGMTALTEKLEVNGNIKLGGGSAIYKISNVLDPTNAQDVATKAYVDAAAAGGGTVVAMSAESAGPYTHGNAAKYCYDLSAAAEVAMDGDITTVYTDWRLPTVEEAAVFEGTIIGSGWVWTATAYQANRDNWIRVTLDGGWSDSAYGQIYYVRCVR